jgi:hemolysin activation/secretion protein
MTELSQSHMRGPRHTQQSLQQAPIHPHPQQQQQQQQQQQLKSSSTVDLEPPLNAKVPNALQSHTQPHDQHTGALGAAAVGTGISHKEEGACEREGLLSGGDSRFGELGNSSSSSSSSSSGLEGGVKGREVYLVYVCRHLDELQLLDAQLLDAAVGRCDVL